MDQAEPARVDQHDLQGNILAGYGLDHSLFMVFRIADPAAGRTWLGELAGQVTTAVPFGASKPASTLNVAVTHEGLAALGVPDGVLASFPDDYRNGMAASAERLGDSGADAPAQWEPGLRPGEPHALVTVTAQEQADLDARRGEVERRASPPDSGIQLVHEQLASVIRAREGDGVAREHFGFADGFAQPSIAGVAAHDPKLKVGPTPRPGQGTPTGSGWQDLAPGEFVLGYPDEAGVVAERPADALRANGSYMVVRKLRQDVALLHRFLHDAAGNDPEGANLLAAKIMGRWPDGTPLALSPDKPAPAAKDGTPSNDFLYGKDGQGLRCPVGAHIRRANPRDALGFEGRLTSRHRIIRRGMPYGPASADPSVDDGIDRGLMFVCYQASIARQFELIQGQWISDGDAFGLGADRDFLLGGEDPRGKMVIPGDPPRLLGPRHSFVTNRGGGYFFAPGVAALKALAAGL
jgi:Dyp-type peroxidase family